MGSFAPEADEEAEPDGFVLRPAVAWEDVDEDGEAEDVILHSTGGERVRIVDVVEHKAVKVEL